MRDRGREIGRQLAEHRLERQPPSPGAAAEGGGGGKRGSDGAAGACREEQDGGHDSGAGSVSMEMPALASGARAAGQVAGSGVGAAGDDEAARFQSLLRENEKLKAKSAALAAAVILRTPAHRPFPFSPSPSRSTLCTPLPRWRRRCMWHRGAALLYHAGWRGADSSARRRASRHS